MHLAAGCFRPKRKRNPLVRLDIEDDGIEFGALAAENLVRGRLELDDDLANPFFQAFSCAQIKRNAAPAPVIHQKLHRYESFRRGIRLDSWVLAITGNRFSVFLSSSVLPSDNVFPNR